MISVNLFLIMKVFRFYLLLTSIFLVEFSVQSFETSESLQNDITLPKLFYYNDTEKCEDGKFFCKLNIKLKPENEENPSDTWKAIEEITDGELYLSTSYDRRWIFYGYCSNDNNETLNIANIKNLGIHGVIPSIETSFCIKNVNILELWDGVDILFLLISVIYLSFFIYSTFRTYEYAKENPDDYYFERVNKYLKYFSALRTWRILIKVNRNEDFVKLLSIQGLRTFTIIFTIIAHTYLGLSGQFSHNPEFLEKLYFIPSVPIFLSMFSMGIQIFFVISSWMLAVKLCNTVKKNGEITMKDISILVLNRYIRLIPEVILITFILRSKILFKIMHPIYLEFVSREVQKCRDNWWINFFFIQNSYSLTPINCNPGTWYIAADFQLHFLMLLAFYLSRKIQISLKYILGGITAIALSIQFYIAIISEFEPNLRFSLRMATKENAFKEPEFAWSYVSTFGQVGSYVIGFIFGMIYTERKHQDIFNTPAKQLFWITSFLGLPYLTCYLYMRKYSRLMEALKAVTFRPLFGLGIAIGILGMATSKGGLIKKILEWKPSVILGNCTYSIYIFHFAVVFTVTLLKSQMTYFSYFFMILEVTFIVSVSLLFGMIIYFILEHPCLELQKDFLPQLKTKRRPKEN